MEQKSKVASKGVGRKISRASPNCQRKKQDRKIAPLSLPYFISIMCERIYFKNLFLPSTAFVNSLTMK